MENKQKNKLIGRRVGTFVWSRKNKREKTKRIKKTEKILESEMYG